MTPGPARLRIPGGLTVSLELAAPRQERQHVGVATIIVDDCISCGVCVEVCPNQAIRSGEQIYVIDHRRCTECVTFHEEEQCARVCPVDACLPDPDREETEEQLMARARKLHPKRELPTPLPSRFRR